MPQSVKELLECLYLDFSMLKDGSWVPDDASIEASTNIIEEIANIIGIELNNTEDL